MSDTALTIFNNLYDNKTHKLAEFKTFAEFEDLLYGLSKVPCASKKNACLISPATYVEGTTRANKNVTGWGAWAALDVDDHVCKGDLKEELHSRFGDYYYICYSTASSTIDQPKFRLVFPTKTEIGTENIRAFWYALNTSFGSMGDQQVKDFSRMYYVPADYDGANNFIFTNDGAILDTDELMKKYPMPPTERKIGGSLFDRLPNDMQAMIVQQRKDNQEQTKVSWTSFHDCKFVKKYMIDQYKEISGTGWYHKMYQLMVQIAANAVRMEYPITSQEIAQLCRQIDLETGNWYGQRPFELEAERAIEYIYRNNY